MGDVWWNASKRFYFLGSLDCSGIWRKVSLRMVLGSLGKWSFGLGFEMFPRLVHCSHLKVCEEGKFGGGMLVH